MYFDTFLNLLQIGSDEEIISALTAQPSLISAKDNQGKTSLIVASLKGNCAIVKLLVSFGADINIADLTGVTPLIAAAGKGFTAIVQYLLSLGALLDAINENNMSALMKAVFLNYSSNYDVAVALISAGANLNLRDNLGYTSLIKAAMLSRLDLVELLASNGADLNLTDCYGGTALFKAASKGQLDIINCLMNYGAKLDVLDNSGRTALAAAVERGNFAVVIALIDHGASLNYCRGGNKAPVVQLVKLGDCHHVGLLADRGADLNVEGIPISIALSKQNNEMLLKLIECGASVNTLCSGTTPLHFAVRQKDFSQVSTLLSHGADPNQVGTSCKSVAMVATASASIGILNALICAGADLNYTSKFAETALLFAIKGTRRSGPEMALSLVKILVAGGASVNLQPPGGPTPLILAARHADLATVTYLLSCGADIDATFAIDTAAAGVARAMAVIEADALDTAAVEQNSRQRDLGLGNGTVLTAAMVATLRCFSAQYNTDVCMDILLRLVSAGADISLGVTTTGASTLDLLVRWGMLDSPIGAQILRDWRWKRCRHFATFLVGAGLLPRGISAAGSGESSAIEAPLQAPPLSGVHMIETSLEVANMAAAVAVLGNLDLCKLIAKFL